MDDLPVGVIQGSGTTQKLYYIEPDHLGTPRIVVDPTRNKAVWTWNIKSEVFGNTPPNEDPDLDGTKFVFDMRFPGQRFDAAGGLIYNYYRDYDLTTGRYLQSDPVGQLGGLDMYGYVGGNPLSFSDPSGLLTVRAYVNRGGGRGNEWRYALEFNPFSVKNAPGWGGMLRKGVNKLETAIKAMKPSGVGPLHPVRDYLECGQLDGKLKDEYERAGYQPGQQLTRAQAEAFLNSMYLSHPEMRKLYDRPGAMLDNAESAGLGNWFNSLMDQAHPGEL